MYQIRQGVFETNSSSAHSLIIKKTGVVITPDNFDTEARTWIGKEDTIRYWDSELEFGRSPFNILSRLDQKLAYVTAAFEEQRDRIIAEVMKRLPNIKGVRFPKDWETDEPVYGWIDHQSLYMLPYAVQKEEIDPVDLILDTRYIIVIDGDEYGVLGDMVQNGLINMDEIEKVYDHGSAYRDKHSELYDSGESEEDDPNV